MLVNVSIGIDFDADDEWLTQGNLEPMTQILEKWNNTFYIRKKLIFEDRMSISEYCIRYSCFQNFPSPLVSCSIKLNIILIHILDFVFMLISRLLYTYI